MLIHGCPNTKNGGVKSKEEDKNFQDNYAKIDWGTKQTICQEKPEDQAT